MQGFIDGFIRLAQDVFGSDAAIITQTQGLYPSPFFTLLIEEKKLVFHLITLEKEKLQNCPPGFFSLWANEAEKNKLRPIQITEDLWHTKHQHIIWQLQSLAGKSATIFGRNTIAKRITKPMADGFLNKNHLIGCVSSRYKAGLFVKKTNELVAVATFSPPRTFYRGGKPSRSYELVRYAGKGGTTITGGLSKLLKTFIEEVNPDDIMTYADRSWWTGDSYTRLGFEMVENTPPQTFWVKPGEWERYPDGKILPEKINKEGFVRIENAGNRKFLLLLS